MGLVLILRNLQSHWKLFAVRKTCSPLFVASNHCVPVETTLGCSTVAFCVWKIIELISVMLYVVVVVHKFDLAL